MMASYGIISLGKKLTHNCLSRLRSIMSTWSSTGVARPPTATKSITHWGLGGTSGAHTTVGVAVSAPG